MQMSQEDWVFAQRAETLRLSGAFGQANKIFEELKTHQDNPWINAHLGTTFRQLMSYERAEELLLDAIEKQPTYFWAHAQLGETYRLWAIVENRNEDYVDDSIEAFTKAIGGDPEQSNYAWALAHLGATYRLKMTGDIDNLIENNVDEASKQKALMCLDRAIELIPTYTWAWGMRATVYRLAQEYESSLWDLAVETVISQNTEVLQNSSSPISGLDSRRSNLHEHAMLAFYQTKTGKKDQQDRNYARAIAYAQQALILNPYDQVVQLMLMVIKAKQEKERQERQGESLSKEYIKEIKEELHNKFLVGRDPAIFNQCKNLLRHLVAVGRVSEQELKNIKVEAGEESILSKFVLVEDLITEGNADVSEDPEKWLWRNFARTQTCTSVMILLSDLVCILQPDPDIDDVYPYVGPARPYQCLALAINCFDCLERLYQTPAFSEDERLEAWENLKDELARLSNIRPSL